MRTNLKQIRELSGKTQEIVANELGISLSTYRSWEQGQRNLNGKRLDLLADYFHVSTDTILGTKHGQPVEELAIEAEQTAASLTLDEMRLLDSFGQLNDNGKDELLNYAAYLLSQDRFQKKDMSDYPTRLQGIA